jgi:hypothetical protein
MRAQCRNVRETIGCTPTLPSVVDPVPDCAALSDDESVASSVCSQNSELEGDYVDDYDDDDGFVHIPNPPPAPNIVNEGAGLKTLFLREMILSRLLREYQYLLRPTFAELMVKLGKISRVDGSVGLM